MRTESLDADCDLVGVDSEGLGHDSLQNTNYQNKTETYTNFIYGIICFVNHIIHGVCVCMCMCMWL